VPYFISGEQSRYLNYQISERIKATIGFGQALLGPEVEDYTHTDQECSSSSRVFRRMNNGGNKIPNKQVFGMS
jgi:hypothetical protein